MAEHGPLVDPATVPAWLRPVVEATRDLDPSMFRRVSPPPANARDAAVLILFGEHETRGPDVLLQLRADGGGAHSGQVAFPGGSSEPERRRPGRDRAAGGRRGDRAGPVRRAAARAAARACASRCPASTSRR